MSQQRQDQKFDRRSFLAMSGFVASGVGMPAAANAAAGPAQLAEPPAAAVRLRVNGTDHEVALDVRTSLLDALREHVLLAGTKKGCDQGQCGACTVLLEGRATLSCLTLAVDVQGQEVVTIEGLARDENLHPMQQAFIDCDAFQCGYCTPGQIVSAVACVATGHAKSAAEIREFMSGNLCRCAAYPNIVAAIEQAAPVMGAKI